jgi:hypothetical protein
MLLFPGTAGRMNARMPSRALTPEGAFSGSATQGVVDLPVLERPSLRLRQATRLSLAKVLRPDT